MISTGSLQTTENYYPQLQNSFAYGIQWLQPFRPMSTMWTKPSRPNSLVIVIIGKSTQQTDNKLLMHYPIYAHCVSSAMHCHDNVCLLIKKKLWTCTTTTAMSAWIYIRRQKRSTLHHRNQRKERKERKKETDSPNNNNSNNKLTTHVWALAKKPSSFCT